MLNIQVLQIYLKSLQKLRIIVWMSTITQSYKHHQIIAPTCLPSLQLGGIKFCHKFMVFLLVFSELLSIIKLFKLVSRRRKRKLNLYCFVNYLWRCFMNLWHNTLHTIDRVFYVKLSQHLTKKQKRSIGKRKLYTDQ